MGEPPLDIIQRAAAKLKEQGRVGPDAAATNPSLSSPAVSGSPPPPRATSADDAGSARSSREVTIDRGRLAKAGIGFPSTERSRIAEEFRIIKRQILAIAERDPPGGVAEHSGRLIMVTSSRPREGKTFNTVNLALAIASEHDCRVLAIDCDGERQGLTDALGIKADVGLVDLLAGEKSDIADVLLRTNIPNLTVLPCGPTRPGIPELLSSKKMRDILKELALRYADRYILIDAPPCLATSDPSILASLVGQIVFIVEANRTQEPEVEEALRLISDCPNISLVLNKTEGASSEQFGSYGYY
jgi:protein-tyrosine kinase